MASNPRRPVTCTARGSSRSLLEETPVNVPARAIDTQTLISVLAGSILVPGDATYDEVRAIWNAMIDRRPAVIVRCANAADVTTAIGFARERGLEISIRGGGHNIAGTSVCDGGVMIDLSLMKQVRVDAAARRAWVEPGALLADVDRATLAHGLVTPLGINSTTGIAGLTLGGGFGWLTRTHGLTVDNLIAVWIVGADSVLRRASVDENADLFWAIRGGGGNFGVVTEFEFALHPIANDVLAGLLVFPMAHVDEILRQYRDFVAQAPEALNVWVVLRKAPPLPFLPAEVHGQEVVVLAVFYTGDAGDGASHIDRLRQFGPVLGEHVGPVPYGAWQQAFDPLLAAGARNYWKSHNFTELADGALAALARYATQLPSDQSEIFVALVSGAANRVPSGAMAYPNRDTRLVVNVHARWEDAASDGACVDWARAFYAASAPFASAGAYVNFMTGDEAARVPAAYGANYARLVELKRRFDPDNVFHVNQNIAP
ncbi:MAG: FAD-binding oxidoreductase [Vicinamibacteraceae bacterium]